jgi:hypothetical protein
VFRATLIGVAKTKRVTLALPRPLLRAIEHLAAEREMSVSALLTESLIQLIDEHRRCAPARRRSMAALTARSLGTIGHAMWTRDELHER